MLHLSEHHGDGLPGIDGLCPHARRCGTIIAEISARGYGYLRPGVESRDWTDAEMTVTDPFGNRIRFGECAAAKDVSRHARTSRSRNRPPWPAPVMEGARFEQVEARRGDLRWPLPKDFVKRLEGQTVTGLGRRAKYLLADLSSGDVLLMHLGMSGSFRVSAWTARRRRRATTITSARRTAAHDHVVFHMSNRARVVDLQRSAPLRLA